MAQLEFP